MSSLKRLVARRRAGQHSQQAPATREPSADGKRSALARLKNARDDHRGNAATLPRSASASLQPQLDTPAAPPSPSGPAPRPGPSHTAHSPRPPDAPTSFQFARPSRTHDVSLAGLLHKSSCVATLKRADAERHSLVTAVQNGREPAILAHVLDNYLPCALACHDIACQLTAKGSRVAKGIVWSSGLSRASDAQRTYEAGLSFEATMVLMFFAVNKLRILLETDAQFGMQDDKALVAQIKSMQAAAGIFAHVRDTVGPAAIANYVGNPPPELSPHVASMLFSLSLCIAQTLHVRRGALNLMSAPLLAKLGASAVDYAVQVVAQFDEIAGTGVSLSSHIRTAATDLQSLSKGWAFRYLAMITPLETDAGTKVCALRVASENLENASCSAMVGTVAALYLDEIKRELDDAAGENRIVYQHAIPKAENLRLPPGRSLANSTTFEPPRVPTEDCLAR